LPHDEKAGHQSFIWSPKAGKNSPNRPFQKKNQIPSGVNISNSENHSKIQAQCNVQHRYVQRPGVIKHANTTERLAK
jgi:hypothetical protein